jgi:V8-like Glu-specific endopeptidase
MFTPANDRPTLLGRCTRSLRGLARRPAPAAARRTARLGLERLESREVFSLTPFSSPYIVELQATFPDHKTYVGTGAMVDRFHVLTAGHVLYSSADGGWASKVQAIPNLNGTSQPYGAAYMTYERTYTAFVNYNKAHPGNTAPGDYDIGLITLDRTIGDKTGWFSYGYDNNNADFAAGAILNTAGYPAAGGYDGRHMEYSGGRIAGLSSDGSAIDYYQSSITTYGGQSGSPVWRYTPSNGKSVIYGVHVGGSGKANSLNFATRITQGIFNDLQKWRTSDPLPRSTAGAWGTAPAPSGSFSLTGNAQAATATLTADLGDGGAARPATLTAGPGDPAPVAPKPSPVVSSPADPMSVASKLWAVPLDPQLTAGWVHHKADGLADPMSLDLAGLSTGPWVG